MRTLKSLKPIYVSFVHFGRSFRQLTTTKNINICFCISWLEVSVCRQACMQACMLSVQEIRST